MDVVVFLTGGTIGMRRGKDGPGVEPCGSLHELFADDLPVDGITIRTVEWSDKPSPHMTPEDMFTLARDMDAVLAEEGVEGAVVLHGTDLLAETSYVLDIALASTKPVVTTGSMRHMEESGYDGQRNLLNSILACLAMKSSSEVVLQMADQIFTARDAVKLDSVSVDPFIGQQRGRVGRIVNEKAEFSQDIHCARPRLPFAVTSLAGNVPLLTCYPGMDADFMAAAMGERDGGFAVCGAVLEGFGAGNVPPGIVPVIKRFIDSGRPLVLATRCVLGGVSAIYGYAGGAARLEEMGAMTAGTLSGTKAQLLLMAALGSGAAPEDIKKAFA